ncbi:hypothetical protein [Undibacterium curvum]|uniref:Uncharacterized protein n=1 Tax=Undibacterium curvum TaxID=2762294 RepID=A0ABR7A090_9BURK|nr:hypothetical protein [Undibacterium curvum]MBC3930117.1 hypothetical protein [Undibacterium curvum]
MKYISSPLFCSSFTFTLVLLWTFCIHLGLVSAEGGLSNLHLSEIFKYFIVALLLSVLISIYGVSKGASEKRVLWIYRVWGGLLLAVGTFIFFCFSVSGLILVGLALTFGSGRAEE